MTINSFYILEPYQPGGSTKHECPQCGRQKCFTRYINKVTGGYLDDTVGICDHKNSCGYHLAPSLYLSGNIKVADYTKEAGVPRTPSVKGQTADAATTTFIPVEIVEKSHSASTTFYRWLSTIAPSQERLKEVYEMYGLGALKDGAVIFWQIDKDGCTREGKIMYYMENGHRDQIRKPNFVGTKFAGFHGIDKNHSRHRHWCLFGEHLLTLMPDKPVCLVESEKTAVVCSLFHPEAVWVATGGCGNLNAQVVEPLRNRRVVVYPDSGCYEEWKEKLSRSCLTNYSVSSALEPFPGNTDLADILIEELSR